MLYSIKLSYVSSLQVIAAPFAITNPAVDLNTLTDNWVGHIESVDIGRWIDLMGVVALGGIPWQVSHLDLKLPHEICFLVIGNPVMSNCSSLWLQYISRTLFEYCNCAEILNHGTRVNSQKAPALQT